MRNYSGSSGVSTPDFHAFFQKDTARGGQRYYQGGVIGSENLASTVNSGIGTAYAVPLLTTRGATVTSLNAYVSNAFGNVGVHGRLGIYQSTDNASNLYPGNLIVDAGEFQLDPAAFKSIVISTALTAGQLYWVALVTEANVAFKAMNSYCMWAINGKASCSTTNWPSTWWSATHAYGAFQATFPTAAATAQEGDAPFLAVTWG